MHTRIDTYENVTAIGGNPFTYVSGVDDYGASAEFYHKYLSAFYSQTPVTSDFGKLELQIAMVFAENSDKWYALKKTIPVGIEPLNDFTLSETIHHTGTDTTSNSGDSIDKRNTFNDATLRNVGEITNSGNGSITYGHTITTSKNAYEIGPLEQMIKYRKIADINLTGIIIKDVVAAITHHIYIKPSNN